MTTVAAPDDIRTEDEQISVRTEYGLVLPNGEVAWGGYRGHPTETAEQRWVLWQALRKTAVEIGFDEDEFLSCYGWVSRRVTTIIRDYANFPLDDPQVCTTPEEVV